MDRMYMGKSFKGPKNKPPKKKIEKEGVFNNFDAVDGDSSSHNRLQGFESIHGDEQSHNGTTDTDFVIPDSVLYNLDFKSKEEKHDIKTKLQRELSSIRSLLKMIEHYSVPKSNVNDAVQGEKSKRVHSDVESMDGISKRKKNLDDSRRVGKEMSQFPRVSDSSFVKEKIPFPSQKKKSKVHGSFLGMNNSSDRSESTTNPGGSEGKASNSQAHGRTRLPKPKAKDPNKRDVTSHEKEKLSANLQDLPPEKLDGVLRIIKKRNPLFCQNDGEIELDIDSLDKETLWDLDRFVINYKKSVSKMKRSVELTQIAVKDEVNLLDKSEDHFAQPTNENDTDDKNKSSSPFVEGEKEDGNVSLSSSSSSDSGSSSSESDTDSSSA